MKRQLLSLMAAAGLLAASCGTTYTTTTSNAAYNVAVPARISANFTTKYPDATNIVWNRYDAANVPIDWEMTGWPALDSNDYVVTFNVGNEQFYAWYDSEGNWIGSSYAISDYTRLPAAVRTMLQSKYPDYAVEEIDRESWKDQVAYEIKLKKDDENKVKLLVDSNGNVLKEKLKD